LQASAGDQTATVGETLKTRDKSATVRVHLRGLPDGVVSLHTDRGRVHEETLPTGGTVQWQTTSTDSMYVRVEVRHPDGAMAALTNPVLLH
jgi:hypothetical protein